MQVFIYIRLFLSIASFFFAGYIAIYFLLLSKKQILFNDAGRTTPDYGPGSCNAGYRQAAPFSHALFIFFLSFFTGIFIVSNLLMLLSLLKIKFSFLIALVFTAVCFLGFCIIIIYEKIHNKAAVYFREAKEDPAAKTALILTAVTWFFIALCFAAVLFFTFLFPIRFWDAISCWSLKGRAFFIDGSITGFYTEHSYGFAHLSYPLYIPLSQTWIYIWLGYADERLVKILFPLFYLSLIFILYYCFNKKFTKLLSSAFVLMLCGLPVAMDHGYLEYTNLIFAVTVFIAVYFFYLYIQQGMHIFKYGKANGLKPLFTSALFFTILSQVRTEGVLFMIIFFIANTVYGLKKYIDVIKTPGRIYAESSRSNPESKGFIQAENYPQGKEGKYNLKTAPSCFIYSILIPPFFSIILALPWQAIKRILGLNVASTEWTNLFLSLGQNSQEGYAIQAFDFAHASGAMVSQLFYSAYDSARAFLGSSYGIIWAVLLILAIAYIKKMFSGPNWVFPIFIIPGFIALFISLGLIPEFAWSTERYVLHLLPLTYFWILYNLPLFKKEQ